MNVIGLKKYWSWQLEKYGVLFRKIWGLAYKIGRDVVMIGFWVIRPSQEVAPILTTKLDETWSCDTKTLGGSLKPLIQTPQIAQLRWRNVANVGMVAVCATTLAQRRHGRRRHNYVGATSFSQRWPNIRKLCWANVFVPTICQRCRPCWNK